MLTNFIFVENKIFNDLKPNKFYYLQVFNWFKFEIIKLMKHVHFMYLFFSQMLSNYLNI